MSNRCYALASQNTYHFRMKKEKLESHTDYLICNKGFATTTGLSVMLAVYDPAICRRRHTLPSPSCQFKLQAILPHYGFPVTIRRRRVIVGAGCFIAAFNAGHRRHGVGSRRFDATVSRMRTDAKNHFPDLDRYWPRQMLVNATGTLNFILSQAAE